MGIPFVKAFSYVGATSTAAQTITLGFAPSGLIVFADGASRNSWIWTSGTTGTVWNVAPGQAGGLQSASTSTTSSSITTATLGFNLPAGFDLINGANIKFYGIAFSNEQ